MKKNLITVLKKLLAAFGGEETQSDNAVEVIDKIADAANGMTEKELPEATTADNGKFLGVDDKGNYMLAEVNSGPDMLIVKIDLSTKKADHAMNEITDALTRYIPVFVTARIKNGTAYPSFTAPLMWDTGNNYMTAVDTRYDPFTKKVTYYQLRLLNSGTEYPTWESSVYTFDTTASS